MKYFKEFELPKNPLISDYCVNIVDFGAIPNGETLNTEAIKNAILHCSENGGGRVVFPAGKWLTGAIHMADNIELHFEENAHVVFTTDKNAYLPVVYTGFEGIRCYNYSPLIYGNGLKNIAITGKGILDGNGMSWWAWKMIDEGINAIYTACMNDTPVEERVYGTEEYGLRPCFVQFVNCENVLIEGITLKNSPFWTVHPLWSDNVIVRNLTLVNPYKSPNTDSINIEGCNTVLVEDCTILGGGDDIYTIKSGRGTDGWNVGKPCENVLIRNCKAFDTRGGGIVIGSEMSGGVRNICAENCEFKNIINGVKIKSKKGRGGYVKNIEYRNIKAENVLFGISITLKYSYDDQFAGNDLEAMPEVCNIHCENFECNGAENAIQLQGVDGCHISDISLKNVSISNAKNGFLAEYADNVNTQNISIT